MASTSAGTALTTDSKSEAEPEQESSIDATKAVADRNVQPIVESVEDSLSRAWKTDEAHSLQTGILAGTFLEATADDEARPFDVFMVHGLHGDTLTAWGENGGHQTSVALREKYPKSRVLYCDYVSDDPRFSVFTLEGIRDFAVLMLNNLLIYREDMGLDQDTVRPIVFIAHDIGGIIVKMALWIAILDYGKYRNILDSVRVLIFFGCPHRSTTDVSLEDMIANLMFSSSPTPQLRFAHNVKTLTKAVLDINGFFELTNLASLLEVINIHSAATNPSQQIFDRYTATFGLPFEEIISRSNSHKDLAKSPEFEPLFAVIDRILDVYPSKADDHSLDSMRIFHDLASPASLIRPFRTLGKRFEWIIQHEKFGDWFNDYGTSLLYVHGADHVSEASAHIVQAIDDINAAKTKGKDIIVAFKFVQFDDRRNSIVNLLTTLLAQILRHHQKMTDFSVFDQLRFYRSWSQIELFFLFTTVLNHSNHEGIIVVIDGIDQCDDSRVIFLQDLCRYLTLTEHRIKILITGVTNVKIEEVLTNHQTINLCQPTSDVFEQTSLEDVRNEYDRLVDYNPALSRFQIELMGFLARFGNDQQLLRLVSNYVKANPYLFTNTTQQAKLKRSAPLSVKDICLRIIQSVPGERQSWARKTILWILFAFRPLKTWELGVALALEFDDIAATEQDVDDFGYSHIALELETVFQGLFLVKNHEIYPAHPEVRDFFLTLNNDRSWYDLGIGGHGEILTSCLQYFSLPQVQKSISRCYLHEPLKGQSAVFPESLDDHFLPGQNSYHRYSFCSYAATYLQRHFKLLPVPSRRALMQPFLKDKLAFRAWTEAQWWLDNPVRRRIRSFISTLPFLANLGLQDLIMLSEDTNYKDRALALTEAVRNGHVDVVHMLIKYDDYTEADLEIAFSTGGSCGNEELLIELVQYAADLTAKRNQTKVSKATPEGDSNSSGGLAEQDVSSDDVEKSQLFSHLTLLSRAVAFSFERLARMLLELGANVQVISVGGYTPLDFAVRQRNPNILKLVIENKAEIGLNRTLSFHPLHLAVIYGMPEMVQQLVDAGINLNLVDTSDITATYLAAWHRHYRAIEPLVKAGADLNNHTVGLWTPLTCCARRDTRKCAEILLKQNANVDVIGFTGWTPLRYTTFLGYFELSKLLLNYKADPNTKSGSEGAPIMCEVAREGNLELVKLLVEYGADVNAADSNQKTALLYAASGGSTESAEYLIDHGANIRDTDDAGYNAVALAAYSSFPKTIEMLARKGVDIHQKTQTNWAPIHYAYDDAETTRVLMDLGADPNQIAQYYTPLILGATFNKPETVKMLLKYKPDLEIPYDNPDQNPGLTALSIAVTYEYTEVVKILLDAGANIDHQSTNGSFCLEYAVRDNNLPLLKMLLEYNPNQKLVDLTGANTALHCVVTATSVDIAKALINAGAPLDIRNKKGHTPLSEIIFEDHLEIAKLLIAKGSDINDVGEQSGGPLHTAVRYSLFESVTMLVEAGGDVNLVNSCVGTPVQAACLRWIRDDDTAGPELREKILRYLIEGCNADLTVEGGDYGCALNAICAFGSSDLVKLVLEKEVKVSVCDRMGRLAVHFAAVRSLQHFLPVHAAGADIEVRDNIGRTVLHWAAIGGNFDVIERVLSLSRHMLDEKDVDGWTPLLWACRGAGIAMNERSIVVQKAVITLLLKRGADPNIVASGGGGEREWSPLRVARYNGGSDMEGFIEWLIAALKEKAGGKLDENAEVHQSKKAKEQDQYCDSCMMTIVGLRHHCKSCYDHDLCTKCFQSVKIIHYPEHEFTEEGPEWEEKAEEVEQKRDEDEDSSDDSEGDEKDKDVSAEVEKEKEKENGIDRGGKEDGSETKKADGRGRRESVEEDSDSDSDSDTDDD